MENKEAAVWVTANQVAARYGISLMALWRWVGDPGLDFPVPIKIRERNYWRIDDIVDWERKAAAKSASRRKTA